MRQLTFTQRVERVSDRYIDLIDLLTNLKGGENTDECFKQILDLLEEMRRDELTLVCMLEGYEKKETTQKGIQIPSFMKKEKA